VRHGAIGDDAAERIRNHMKRLRKPTEPPDINPQEYRTAKTMDKKVVAGEIRLVLLNGIGAAEVTANYPDHELVDMLRGQFIH
jgi:3-dehydroquinate synthase